MTKWIEELKLAIIKDDEEKIETLVESIPQGSYSIDTLKRASALLSETNNLYKKKQLQLTRKMKNIKRDRELLTSYINKTDSTFNKTV